MGENVMVTMVTEEIRKRKLDELVAALIEMNYSLCRRKDAMQGMQLALDQDQAEYDKLVALADSDLDAAWLAVKKRNMSRM